MSLDSTCEKFDQHVENHPFRISLWGEGLQLEGFEIREWLDENREAVLRYLAESSLEREQ